MVSYSTWDKGDSSRQETICEWFLIRHETVVYHSDRKLLANGFPFGMGQWYIIATGNCSAGDFSTPLRCARNDRGGENYCVSWRQETVCDGFLFGVGQRGFIATGNCLRMGSHSAWGSGVSSWQETVCEWVPIRRGAMLYHSGRKLFAMVSYSTWENGDS